MTLNRHFSGQGHNHFCVFKSDRQLYNSSQSHLSKLLNSNKDPFHSCSTPLCLEFSSSMTACHEKLLLINQLSAQMSLPSRGFFLISQLNTVTKAHTIILSLVQFLISGKTLFTVIQFYLFMYPFIFQVIICLSNIEYKCLENRDLLWLVH